MYLENLSLKVDTQKCNLCGACVRECVNNVLTKNEQGTIAVIPGGEARCIHCAHCMMVCPSAALSIDGLDPEKDFEPALRGPEFGKLLNQVKSRRSIRHFKQRNVDEDVMADLLDALRYPPTGVNYRNLQFSVISDCDIMEQYREKLYKRYFDRFENDPDTKNICAAWKDALANGGDPVFRTAPHLLLVNHDENAPCGPADAVIALSYFEMLANAAGVGTVWFGRLIMLFKQMPELMDMFDIPAGYKPGYAMLFGYGDNLFRRTIKRDLPAITHLK